MLAEPKPAAARAGDDDRQVVILVRRPVAETGAEGKGDMGKVMRYTKAALELVATTREIPTKYLDE